MQSQSQHKISRKTGTETGSNYQLGRGQLVIWVCHQDATVSVENGWPVEAGSQTYRALLEMPVSSE